MFTSKNMERSVLAQMIAARKGCAICGKKPTIYQVRMKGFCSQHKGAAEAMRRSNYREYTALQDVKQARVRDSMAILDKKRIPVYGKGKS